MQTLLYRLQYALMHILCHLTPLLTSFPILSLRSRREVSKCSCGSLCFQPHSTFIQTKPRVRQLPFYDPVEDTLDRWTGRDPEGVAHRLALHEL